MVSLGFYQYQPSQSQKIKKKHNYVCVCIIMAGIKIVVVVVVVVVVSTFHGGLNIGNCLYLCCKMVAAFQDRHNKAHHRQIFIFFIGVVPEILGG